MVDNEAAELRKIVEQQASLVADLQRKLLQGGITPENILRLQKEARDKARHIVAASMPHDFSRKEQQHKQQKEQPKSKRKMKFPLFNKAS
jgi:copper homeostasis protein CutC